ncbi:unnamed protein product [Phaeothamnion confervicola]
MPIFDSTPDRLARDGDVEQLGKLLAKYAERHGGISQAEVVAEVKDGNGRGVLHLAAIGSQAEAIEFLLNKCPAARDAQDDKGLTPLALALITGSKAACDALLVAGANPDVPDKDGVRCVHRAAGAGDCKGLEALHKANADMDAQSGAGAALHWAAGAGASAATAAATATLLRVGVKVDPANQQGLTPLVMAVAAGADATAALLVNAGADPGHVLSGGITILHMAAELALPDTVAAILNTDTGRKCALTRSEAGLLPLHLAAMATDAAAAEGDAVAPGARRCVELLTPRSGLEDGAAASELDTLAAEGNRLMGIAEAAEKAAAAAASAGSASEPATDSSVGAPAGREGAFSEEEELWGTEATTPPANPDDGAAALACKERGNAAYATKRLDEAVEHYTASIMLDGSNAAVWSNRSAALLAAGRHAAALKDAEVCRRLRPDWQKAFYRVAAAKMALGHYEGAAVAAWEGMRLDSGNAELRALLQMSVEAGRKEHQEGLKAAAPAKTAASSDPAPSSSPADAAKT